MRFSKSNQWSDVLCTSSSHTLRLSCSLLLNVRVCIPFMLTLCKRAYPCTSDILPSHAVSGRFYLSCMVMTIQLDHLSVFLFFPSCSLWITATVRGAVCCLQARGRAERGGEGEERVIVGRAWVQSR